MLFDFLSRDALDSGVGIAQLFSGEVSLVGEVLFELFFHSDEVEELIQEPLVHHRYFMYLVNAHASAQSLIDNEQSLVITVVYPCLYLVVGKLGELG